jgi:hypothetical protein
MAPIEWWKQVQDGPIDFSAGLTNSLTQLWDRSAATRDDWVRSALRVRLVLLDHYFLDRFHWDDNQAHHDGNEIGRVLPGARSLASRISIRCHSLHYGAHRPSPTRLLNVQ